MRNNAGMSLSVGCQVGNVGLESHNVMWRFDDGAEGAI
jgi:hypothetical protein